MDWTSQDDIEGECAPTQLVPASQACDLAEESALEFNPDQSQDAWGARGRRNSVCAAIC